MGFADRVRGRRTKRQAAKIERQRWALVEREIGPSERRLITTPAFVWVPPHGFVGTHVYLTTEKLITACVEPPFGTERQPGVIVFRTPTIGRLVVADDGTFVVLAPGRESPTVQTVLNLYPDPFSQALLAELRTRWENATGRKVEGNWSIWFDKDPLPAGNWEKYLSG